MSNVLTSITEYFKWLGGNINQVDCPEEVEIEDPTLIESLKRVEEMESATQKVKPTSKKSGKGKSAPVVEKVVIDPRVAKAAVGKQQASKQSESEMER